MISQSAVGSRGDKPEPIGSAPQPGVAVTSNDLQTPFQTFFARSGLRQIPIVVELVEPRHPAVQRLAAYWESKRSGENLPLRDDIRPQDITPLLPYVFIAEPASQTWRYRLAGTELARRSKVEWTGKTLDEVFEPTTAKEAKRLYDSVAQRQLPTCVRGCYLGLRIEDAIFEAIDLPILARNGDATWIFGGVFLF